MAAENVDSISFYHFGLVWISIVEHLGKQHEQIWDNLGSWPDFDYLGASTRKVVHVPKVVQQERQHHFHVEETVDVPIEQHVEQVVHVPVVSRGERIVHNPVDLEVEMGC